MVPLFLVTRAGVGDRLGGLRRSERLVPAPKKISLSEGRNSFIPTFTQPKGHHAHVPVQFQF